MAEDGSDALLRGWSARVEELVDQQDHDGAVNLLEEVIAKLSLGENAASNLGLAAALQDLGGLYASEGLSLRADSLLSSSLVIRQRAEKQASSAAGDQHPSPEFASLGIDHHSGAGDGTSYQREFGPEAGATDHDRADRDGELSTVGAHDEEEDWEAVVPSLLTKPPAFSLPLPTESSASVEKDIPKQKQRGRGAFTYGGGGLYSDGVDRSSSLEGCEVADWNDTDGASEHWDGGADHVLLISGFSPMMKTKDLENLVKPYSSQGVSIRWVDDSTALAVFSTPALARQALAGIHDPRFKVQRYSEGNAMISRSSLNDLEPPAQRPATSARVAQRMIAGALSKQGVSNNLRAKSRVNAEQARIQELERKQRLLTRHQLRDEAWGDD
ncbi:hypothetical protein BDL97_16G039400 [Sphagnum fallax]|nr:hypothetical protein BDL97_16G039400 [Sphagnum fallax]KAH8937646.1 hypothetical protein BDL97_16G039400 [Sphagnum fallax]KAH8937647.1 hypothetical protein BDL97_16G039400 [Sphagnum fallax]